MTIVSCPALGPPGQSLEVAMTAKAVRNARAGAWAHRIEKPRGKKKKV